MKTLDWRAFLDRLLKVCKTFTRRFNSDPRLQKPHKNGAFRVVSHG